MSEEKVGINKKSEPNEKQESCDNGLDPWTDSLEEAYLDTYY